MTRDDQPVMTWVRWDVTAHVCADDCWKIMPDFQPPRLLTVGWPTPGQLESSAAKELARYSARVYGCRGREYTSSTDRDRDAPVAAKASLTAPWWN
jgi:hypothetical protein